MGNKLVRGIRSFGSLLDPRSVQPAKFDPRRLVGRQTNVAASILEKHGYKMMKGSGEHLAMRGGLYRIVYRKPGKLTRPIMVEHDLGNNKIVAVKVGNGKWAEDVGSG